MPRTSGHQSRGRGRAGTVGFTLIELLVVVTIVSVLVGVVLATLAKVRATSWSFVCKNNLKTVAFEFVQFADEFHHPDRGDSEKFGRGRFDVEDFLEKLYRVSEFWDTPGPEQADCDPSEEPMMCPAGPRILQRRSKLPCYKYAVGPADNVSVGINMRLDRASLQIAGRWILAPVLLTPRLREHASVPLAFDVDGAAAAERRLLPYYAAPPAGDEGQYADGRFWFPALRHAGKLNTVFVGGHVLSSPDPENEPGWDWDYQDTSNCYHPGGR